MPGSTLPINVVKCLAFYALASSYRTLKLRDEIYGKEADTRINIGTPDVILDKGKRAKNILKEYNLI